MPDGGSPSTPVGALGLAPAPLATPRPEVLPHLERMGDPLNRFYRYPAARALLPIFRETFVTPNQVTLAHTLVGLGAAAAVAHGSTRGLYAAFVLSEIRLVLDCFDGVLARAKGLGSPWGRTLDELGDAVSYVALSAGIYWHVHRTHPAVTALPPTILMLAVGGLMAWVTDFYKRKLTSALESGRDGIYEELLPKWRKLHPRAGTSSAGFLERFGFWFDWMQVVILQGSVRGAIRRQLESGSDAPPATSAHEVAHLIERGTSREVKTVMRALSAMSADNVIGIVNLGLLTGSLLATQAAVIAYGVFAMLVGVYLSNRLLHQGRVRGRTIAPSARHAAPDVEPPPASPRSVPPT